MDEMSNEAMTTEETSGSSDSVLRLTKPMKPDSATTTKYKGVVPQKNGHWGAQIYAEHRRIWLGTFKSAVEAATAYDSASIKLRSYDANSHRNFPWSDFTLKEPEFQQGFPTETVLNMIRDGSYQHKFRDFLTIKSEIVAQVQGERQVDQGSNKFFSCTQLFQKELTPSDVGKLNRLVIPKKYAVKHLPLISHDQNEREEGEIGGAVEDVEVVFYDRAMRPWKFRYCYWRSSQSFVFTRGWNSFVKEKNLKEKDVIVFYTCDVPSNVEILHGQSNKFLMIDVHKFSDKDFVVADQVHNSSSDEELKTGNVFSSKLENEETKTEDKSGGFMLFGVRIQ